MSCLKRLKCPLPAVRSPAVLGAPSSASLPHVPPKPPTHFEPFNLATEQRGCSQKLPHPHHVQPISRQLRFREYGPWYLPPRGLSFSERCGTVHCAAVF